MRTQADLVDQLFNSSEKRLARILLLLAEFGKPGEPEPLIPEITQETLAEIIGTTRSRELLHESLSVAPEFIDRCSTSFCTTEKYSTPSPQRQAILAQADRGVDRGARPRACRTAKHSPAG
jgi:hypothetical protein